MTAPLRIDPDLPDMETGIFVRAQHLDGSWGSPDMSQLDDESLVRWLRTRGGENRWAESVVFLLIGRSPPRDDGAEQQQDEAGS